MSVFADAPRVATPASAPASAPAAEELAQEVANGVDRDGHIAAPSNHHKERSQAGGNCCGSDWVEQKGRVGLGRIGSDRISRGRRATL